MSRFAPLLLALVLASPQAQAHNPSVGENIGGALLTGVSSVGFLGSLLWIGATAPVQLLTCTRFYGSAPIVHIDTTESAWCRGVNVVGGGPAVLTGSGIRKGLEMMEFTDHNHGKKKKKRYRRRGR